MSEVDTDDLEKTLMLAAADANSRNCEVLPQRGSVIKKIESDVETNNSTPIIEKELLPLPPQTHGVKRKQLCEITSPEKVVKINEKDSVSNELAKQESFAGIVASHYNTLKETGLDERSKSRIVYMRNFHNWIKSMLINENLTKVKDSKRHKVPIRVLDMCCGKGGDLLKWRKGGISHLICSDIAAVSLDQCKSRYQDMHDRGNGRDRNSGNIFSIEYIAGDCSRLRLREKYKDPSMKLDLVSCQFAFHYSFESLPQAECMLRNGSECLNPGGFFIGTMPDANELIARTKKSDTNTFGNDVFQVTFDCNVNNPPLFGSKYHFQLDGVVNCPEFLVHFPTFVKLAKKYGLTLVKKEKFSAFYERMKSEGRNLLSAMKSLESFPQEHNGLVGNSKDDYTHAEDFLKDNKDQQLKIGTLSKSEWEVSSLYLTFVFEKVKNTWNADGTPKYEFN